MFRLVFDLFKIAVDVLNHILGWALSSAFGGHHPLVPLGGIGLPQPGATAALIRGTLGDPQRVRRTTLKSGVREVWGYDPSLRVRHRVDVWIMDGVVERVVEKVR